MIIDIPKSIENQNAMAVDAFNQHNWKVLERTYEEDAIVVLSNGRKLEGRKAIAKYFSELEDIEDLKYTILSADSSGDLSYEILQFHYRLESQNAEVNLEVLQVLKQKKGEWHIQAAFYSNPDRDSVVH